MRDGGFGFCGAAGQDHLSTPTWLDAATQADATQYCGPWQRQSAGRVQSICCYDHAVYMCVWSMQFRSFAVEWDISIAIIITMFNKTCGM